MYSQNNDAYILPSGVSHESYINIGASGQTQTTPTLTPTTLKNIQESFYEFSSRDIPSAPREHQNQAGFVPPVVNIGQCHYSKSSDFAAMNASDYSNSNSEDDDDIMSQSWLESNTDVSNDGHLSPTTQLSTLNFLIKSKEKPSKAKSSGRRSRTNEKLSPEEEIRRRVRRERNKQAAARCRKRRLDHTNSLLKETEGLEDKKATLQNEIHLLESQKDDLEYLLKNHKTQCKFHLKEMSSMRSNRPRPNSLQISGIYSLKPGFNKTSGHDIPIQTPSKGLLNLESLMDSGTGFTPIFGPVSTTGSAISTSSCGGQERNGGSNDLPSPESLGPPKLVSL